MDQKVLGEIKSGDYPAIARSIGGFLSGEAERRGSAGVTFGLSGGIDSAVLAFICGRAMKGRTLAMIMPDTDVTPGSETEDALRVAEMAGIDYKLVDIRPIVGEYSRYVEPDGRARGNLRARVRANILYYYANAKGYLVLGSSDRSEHLLGYFTKFGDGAADLAPIVSLYKLQVREIAGFLGVPPGIIAKKSSPHLWEGQTAEGEIGATYEEIDAVLYCLFDRGMSEAQAADATGLGEALVGKVRRACDAGRHKREPPARPGGAPA